MHVEVRTDNHIHGSDKLFEEIRVGIESTLKRYTEQITRSRGSPRRRQRPQGRRDDSAA